MQGRASPARKEGGERMKVVFKGKPKEIAALVVAIQERQLMERLVADEASVSQVAYDFIRDLAERFQAKDDTSLKVRE